MSERANRKLQRAAQKLAQQFFDDAQRLFDDALMNDETNESPVFEALLVVQSYAEDVVNAEVVS